MKVAWVSIMKVNLDGLLLGAADSVQGPYGYSLRELAGNLRELHDRGDEAALREFFSVYVFGRATESQPVRQDNA